MSMNIHLRAELSGTFTSDDSKKTCKHKFTEWFDCYQTPTEVSYHIIDVNDFDERTKRYEEYVLSITSETEVNVYADDDYFGLKDPIGTRKEHFGKQHIKELHNFIRKYKEEGYSLEWVVS